MRTRVAWCVVALAVVAFTLDTAFTAVHLSLLSKAAWVDHGWPLIPLGGVGCALMGALVVSLRPRQRLGWLLCAASLLSVTLAAEAYAAWVLDGGGPGSPEWAHTSAWVGSLLGWPAFTAIIMIFLTSPDGRLLSPRWRWAAVVTVAGLALHTLGTTMISPAGFVYGEQYGGGTVTAVVLMAGVALVAVGLVAAAVSLVVRLRQARDDARRQLLWIASSAVALAIGVMVALAVPQAQGEGATWLAALPLGLAQLAFPLCVAVAVLRHRLVEIDLIVNRALVLAAAAGLVAAGYVAVVVVVGRGVGGSAGGFWPSLLATALVAMAFQPLRRRVVGLADRLSFGAAATPYVALADFSRRLGDRPDPSALLPAMADAAARAVNASRATVVLRVEAGPDRVATWPALEGGYAPAAGNETPVLHRGERLGSITVHMPAGHPLRERDQRLLADLADQAGMAFHNARLTAELSGRVEELDRHTRELAASRRRLITAGDAERSRVERAISRDVVLHLAGLPEQLDDLSRSYGSADRPPPDPALLGPVGDALRAALEALREITRGVFPAQLARSGLAPALASLLARDGTTGRLVVDPDVEGRRFDPRVEAAAYFCVAETVHALGESVAVSITAHDGELRLLVTGTDRGGVSLSHMRDRVEAAGGSVSMTGSTGHVTLEVRLPADAPQPERIPVG